MVLQNRWPAVCALLYAEAADSTRAIEALKAGALDFLQKPLDPVGLGEHIEAGLRISREIHAPGRPDAPRERPIEHFVGQSPAMKDVYKRIGLIAPRDINVLITGESGTGKELVARAIVQHSQRAATSYLAVNCAAIPETLLESELFGHEKGAFTGAESRRIGTFEQCHGGTLFLDEVGDIPLATQAKLLRVLQENTIQRLGSTSTVTCDVRILAATHQPLEQRIAQGSFRQDLYYRLKVASIHLPPLRERDIDVVLLAHQFVQRFNRQFGTTVRSFAPETLPLLLNYAWPGNVRELENAIKSALVVARGSVLQPEFLPEHLLNGAAGPRPPGPAIPPSDARNTAALRSSVEQLLRQPHLRGRVFHTAVAQTERHLIRAGLETTGGKLSHTADLLGISRTTLRKKMGELGISTTVQLAS